MSDPFCMFLTIYNSENKLSLLSFAYSRSSVGCGQVVSKLFISCQKVVGKLSVYFDGMSVRCW